MTVIVAATQMASTWNRDDNLRIAEDMVHQAASRGARIVLLQELFETPYFCIDEAERFFELAAPVADNAAVRWASNLAAELGVVLPVSEFERSNNALFNSVVIVDSFDHRRVAGDAVTGPRPAPTH